MAAGQVVLNVNVDVGPPGGGALQVSNDNVQASFNTTERHGDAFTLAPTTSQAIAFGGIVAAQLLFVTSSLPIELDVTFGGVVTRLYGTIFLVTQPDATHPITAATATAVGTGNTPDVNVIIAA